MNGIIDFHTHAFPDSLAHKAIKVLSTEGRIGAELDGKLSSLISSMDETGIEKSVICSIATKPSQFNSILEWSKLIRSDRIVPLPSVHPEDPEAVERIGIIKKEGFCGIKMHPYYQKFNLDDPKMFYLYEKISKENLLLVMHTGFDIAFERIRKADPEKIMKVVNRFPSLKMVSTHLGAWEDWDEVEKFMLGKKVFMELSFSLGFIDIDKAKNIILKHPQEYILFGTDSPWASQENTLQLFKKLSLGEELENLILRKNALSLLNLVRN
ncbi:amidohydrolase family protein [bacterium]|nr:amidohydrolase family protein [bacterium]